jgi:putative aldouronate transport system substrate-binding protein
MKGKKVLLFLVFALTAALLMGGGQKAPAPAAPAASPAAGASASGLPLTSTPTTLRMFIEMDQSKVGVHTANYADLLCFTELEKMTNVKVDFIHPPAGMAAEQINLMMAAADMPDMTYWNWAGIPGGISKSLADNIILPLNDIIPKYPYYSKMLKDEPLLDKDVKTDEGFYYCYPLVYRSAEMKNTYGFMIRKDWLNKLGLPMPETMDDWYKTLVAFRDNDPDKTGRKVFPMVSLYSQGAGDHGADAVKAFYGAWGKHDSMYVNNNKVYYGAYEPAYKEYLLTMRKWIAEGLIDPNFPTLNQTQADASMLNGVSGACRDGLGLGLDKFYAHFQSDDVVVAAPFPVLTKGAQSYNFMSTGRDFGGSGAALSPTGKNNDLAAKWLDYCFEEKASLLLNFGVEGRTYNWIDGYPQLVDDIYRNPQGESVNVALGRYAVGVTVFPFLNDPRIREQRLLRTRVQKEGHQLWNTTNISRVLPLVSFTADESRELSEIMSEVTTFMKEYTLSFLLGNRDINREFDTYISTLKNLKIERAIAINQAAVDRYYKR